MPYWRLFYHIVFTTRNREPVIVPEIEPYLWGYIVEKGRAMEAIIYAVNGMEDHVHIVAAVPPKLSVAVFVGEVKGASAHYVNHHIPVQMESPLVWQRGYGVLSFGEKDLQRAVEYVRRQKEHHRGGTTFAALERTEETDNPPGSPDRQPPDSQNQRR